ncbi:MAG: hypothetical protein DRN08_03610 [Thermoplasmata archaeon]|nr:MAG: hypothetical protein DRN05_03995 [Thermoplasmata archaeon]RLF35095.1 MAG: hypothetical protein DRN08_03610 [Thermoplasmata archaeon]
MRESIIEPVVWIFILIIAALLSGCLDTTENINPGSSDGHNNNLAPQPVVSATGIISNPPEYVDQTLVDAVAYAGEHVTLDASQSYDPDGHIIGYRWFFYDNTVSEQSMVSRVFEIKNISSLKGLPLIYTIVLEVEDNNHSYGFLEYRLGVIPREYTLYFDSTRLSWTKPGESCSGIRAARGILRDVSRLNYVLEKTVFLQPCRWNATLYIEKPVLAHIRSVTLILYNGTGEKITEKTVNLGLVGFWREKAVSFSGKINREEEFRGIELVITGFSLGEKINVLYGDGKASFISFDFLERF